MFQVSPFRGQTQQCPLPLSLQQRQKQGRLLGRQPAFYGLSVPGREEGRKEGQLCKKSRAGARRASCSMGGSAPAPYCVANTLPSFPPSDGSAPFASFACSCSLIACLVRLEKFWSCGAVNRRIGLSEFLLDGMVKLNQWPMCKWTAAGRYSLGILEQNLAS